MSYQQPSDHRVDAAALIVTVWIVADIILGISYGIYKLARRPA